jgi:uncharacterized protein YceH (UPF0502 family)
MIDRALNEAEVRALGCLVEKAITTPENYPLSLNALVNACNQKSNRDPVVEYDSSTVAFAIDSLKPLGLVRIIMGGDSRVPKYRHYFDEAYELNLAEAAILCELMLRGPQTPGELRGRTERLENRQSVEGAEATLERLVSRQLAVKLPRQPGRKESRYAHLLAGMPDIEALAAEAEAPRVSTRPGAERMAELEAQVAGLREEIEALKEEFARFRQQFE